MLDTFAKIVPSFGLNLSDCDQAWRISGNTSNLSHILHELGRHVYFCRSLAQTTQCADIASTSEVSENL